LDAAVPQPAALGAVPGLQGWLPFSASAGSGALAPARPKVDGGEPARGGDRPSGTETKLG